MPGIRGVFNRKNLNVDYYLIGDNDTIVNEKMIINRNFLEKFKNDKIFYQNDQYIIVMDGIVLNSIDLVKKHTCDSWVDTIIKMYEIIGERFMDELRGSFCGVVYNKISNEVIIFNNHYGDKPVFYYRENDTIIFSNSIKDIVENLKVNNISYTFSSEAAYELVTYGYMIEDNTLVKEVKRLGGGRYIKIIGSQFSLNNYYSIDNNILLSENEDEIIEKIDEAFRYAVDLCMKKDIEYGYDHLVGLSGGLDSRMTTWVANDLGYDKVTNYTFSKSNYLDFSIAQEIAKDLNNEYIFKNLDDLKYIKFIDKVIENNSGTGCASGHIHGKSMLDMINFNKYGLIHTGQLGDVVVGTFSSTKEHKNASTGMGAYSNILLNKVSDSSFNNYKNEELFKMYNRGLNGALNSHLTMQNYSEVVSPFLVKEFFDLCLSIDPNIRINHNLYYKWILKKYPKAATYKYEKIKIKFNSNLYKNKLLYKLVVKAPNKLGNKFNNIKFKLGLIKSKAIKNDMNPFQYWFDTDDNMKEYIDNYFKEHIELISFNKELYKDLNFMYEQCEAREKIQILSLLSSYKLIFQKEECYE